MTLAAAMDFDHINNKFLDGYGFDSNNFPTILTRTCLIIMMLYDQLKKKDILYQGFIWANNFGGGDREERSGPMGRLGGPRGWVREGDVPPPM